MFLPTHRHADGGLYQHLGPQDGKMEPGDWEHGQAYRNEEGMLFWTDNLRWDERFTRIAEPTITTLDIIDDQDEVVCHLQFQKIDVDDVRHLYLHAAEARPKKVAPEFLDWMKRVMKMQVEMVGQGLHIRDHDFPDLIGDVNAFHAKFGQEYTGKPRLLPDDLFDFRIKFHDEETSEYRDEQELLKGAIVREDRRDIIHHLEQQLDALADAAWVILGTADLQFGRRAFIEAWRRVVKANMAKVPKAQTADGDGSIDSGRAPKYDIVKPAGWLPPDHSDLVSDNAIFDELFNRDPELPIEHSPMNQSVTAYSDTRSV